MPIDAVAVKRPVVPGLESLRAFAREVGPAEDGPVTVVGGRTHWDIGGPSDPAVRQVRAPSGIVEYAPTEMIVRVGAGTTVAELDTTLAAAGQMIPLDPADPSLATIGGVLAVGRSGIRRLRWGPIRDTVLEAHFVTAAGAIARSGGPVVKNVTGFDLGKLMVGSLGTLAFIGQVVLRTQPRPEMQQWWRVPDVDPARLLASLYRASSVLWDGAVAWVLLEGHSADVVAQASVLGPTAAEVAGPPVVPTGGRLSLAPADALAVNPADHGDFLAELGVGVVHTVSTLAIERGVTAGIAKIASRLKAAFDPSGRLNPGRSVA